MVDFDIRLGNYEHKVRQITNNFGGGNEHGHTTNAKDSQIVYTVYTERSGNIYVIHQGTQEGQPMTFTGRIA